MMEGCTPGPRSSQAAHPDLVTGPASGSSQDCTKRRGPFLTQCCRQVSQPLHLNVECLGRVKFIVIVRRWKTCVGLNHPSYWLGLTAAHEEKTWLRLGGKLLKIASPPSRGDKGHLSSSSGMSWSSLSHSMTFSLQKEINRKKYKHWIIFPRPQKVSQGLVITLEA